MVSLVLITICAILVVMFLFALYTSLYPPKDKIYYVTYIMHNDHAQRTITIIAPSKADIPHELELQHPKPYLIRVVNIEEAKINN